MLVLTLSTLSVLEMTTIPISWLGLLTKKTEISTSSKTSAKLEFVSSTVLVNFSQYLLKMLPSVLLLNHLDIWVMSWFRKHLVEKKCGLSTKTTSTPQNFFRSTKEWRKTTWSNLNFLPIEEIFKTMRKVALWPLLGARWIALMVSNVSTSNHLST